MAALTFQAFLSTPSARRATWYTDLMEIRRTDFYPRPPRGGRLLSFSVARGSRSFLSTPSARRATFVFRRCGTLGAFLSTPSARRATRDRCHCGSWRSISIHALREEGDIAGTRPDVRKSKISIHALREEGDAEPTGNAYGLLQDFYPRPPRGGRQPAAVRRFLSESFLSTPSARRATFPGLHGR